MTIDFFECKQQLELGCGLYFTARVCFTKASFSMRIKNSEINHQQWQAYTSHTELYCDGLQLVPMRLLRVCFHVHQMPTTFYWK